MYSHGAAVINLSGTDNEMERVNALMREMKRRHYMHRLWFTHTSTWNMWDEHQIPIVIIIHKTLVNNDNPFQQHKAINISFAYSHFCTYKILVAFTSQPIVISQVVTLKNKVKSHVVFYCIATQARSPRAYFNVISDRNNVWN